MSIKKFLRPEIPKLLIFLFIGVFYLYFAKENVSAAGFGFAFFYDAYGFPFQYLIIGDTSSLPILANEMFLGNHFAKYGSVLLNPAALALNTTLIYLLACLMSVLFSRMKPSGENS